MLGFVVYVFYFFVFLEGVLVSIVCVYLVGF